MRRIDRPRTLNLIAATLVGTIAVVAMLGWVIKGQFLVQLHPHLAPMQFNTGLCFLLFATSLAMIDTEMRWTAAIPALLGSLIGGLTLFQYITGQDLGIDMLFMTPFTTAQATSPGRMAMNTSAGLLGCGLVLAFGALSRGTGWFYALGFALLGSAVGSIGLLALTGEIAGIDIASVWGRYTHMALHSAICFIILSVTIIAMAKTRSAGRSLWLPIPIFLGIIAVTFGVVQAMRAGQEAKLYNAVVIEGRHASRLVEQNLAETYRSLERLAQRWEANGGTPRAQWEQDAAGYIHDFTTFRAMFWADASGQVQWSSGADGVLANLNLEIIPSIGPTLHWAAETRQPRATPIITQQPEVLRGAFLHLRPLYVNGRYNGVIGTVIDVAAMFNDRLAGSTLDRLWITVSENGKQIFTNLDALPARPSRFEESVMLTNLSRVWLIVASPKDVLGKSMDAAPVSLVSIIGFLFATLVAYSVFQALKREEDHNRLRISEERLALAVSGTRDGLWDWNLVTGGVYYAPRLREMLGYGGEEFAPSPAAFVERVHPDDRDGFIAATQDHFGSPRQVIFRVAHKDGHWVWLSARGQDVLDEDGKAVRLTGFMADISHEKEVERLKNEFVSTVSHELRTPLTSIRGALALMRNGVLGTLPGRVQEMANIAHKNCERLILLINDILDLDKIESGQTRFDLAEESLNRLLHDAVEANRSFAVKDGVQLVFDPVMPEVKVKVDPGRLIQVMNNLISNAAKFSPANEVVTVSAMRRGPKVRVCITDRGPGIPENFHNRIFGKFAQADASDTRGQTGTGLGLHITQEIVKRLGGDIGFDTATGQGTTFWFELPEIPRLEAPAAGSVISLPPKTGAPVLIVEDDEDASAVLQELLLREGFRSVAAYSLAEARQRLGKSAYQALILDLMLPDGNGVDLIREIRESEGAGAEPLPIIVTSLKAEEGRAALNGGAIGVVDWLRKEIDPVELIAALRRCVKNIGDQPIRILHIEDDPDLRLVIAQMVRDKAAVVAADTVEEGLRQLTTDHFDLMILEIGLSNGSGLEVLERLGSFQVKLPVLILSAQEADEDVRARVAGTLVKSRVSEKKVAEMIANLVNASTKEGRQAA